VNDGTLERPVFDYTAQVSGHFVLALGCVCAAARLTLAALLRLPRTGLHTVRCADEPTAASTRWFVRSRRLPGRAFAAKRTCLRPSGPVDGRLAARFSRRVLRSSL